MKKRKAWHRAGAAALLAVAPLLARADQETGSTTARADLDLVVAIGKFIFFRVGSASNTPDTVSFDAVPTIPAGAVTPIPGNGTTVNWNGVLPTFAATATSLPVEVRSNAGVVSIRAVATTPLTSGGNTIPLSQIVLTSSDANLPAPVVPNTGTGLPVNVAASGFANRVTERTATWTFSYNPVVTQRAGQYNGQISFTATSP